MKIVDGLSSDKPSFSFEISPKNEAGLKGLYEAIEYLIPTNPLFVSVTYGAGGTTRGQTVEISAHIKNSMGVETMAHLTCLGHSVQELEEILVKLRENGVENVLALRGDPPKDGSAGPSGFKYAAELVKFIRARGDFCICAACYPEKHTESSSFERDLDHLKEKVDAGVDFLITQLFFKPEIYFRFVEKAHSRGIKVPIIPGIMPVTSVSQLERFVSMCGATIPLDLASRLEPIRESRPKVVEEGIRWSVEQSKALLEGGAPGIHFYTLNRSHSARIICERLSGFGA